MKARYYPTTDTLYMEVSSTPSADSEEVKEGFVFDFDAEGRLVGIEVESASERVDLTDIKADPGQIVDDSGGPVVMYTVSELARKWDIAPRTVQKTIKAMREAGIDIGRKSTGRIDNAPIILSHEDAEKIGQWRERHRPGRPRLFGSIKDGVSIHGDIAASIGEQWEADS